MVGLLPLLLLRPSVPYTLSMPRPLTALSLGDAGINGWVPLVAGDTEGALYAPTPTGSNPIGRVPGRVIALRCLNGMGEVPFVVAYAPPSGDERVELWRRVGGRGERSASLGTLPPDSRALVALGRSGFAVGSVRGRGASLYDADGNALGRVALPEGVVGLANAGDRDAGTAFVAALADGEARAYGADGAVRWRRTLPIRGRLLDFEGRGECAAWATDEAGGRVGVLNLMDGKPVGTAYAAPGVARAEALWSGLPLIVGGRAVDVRRHAAPWSFPAPVVAADAGAARVAVALADGTLVVRDPLRAWVRKGEAALLAP